MQRHIKIAFCHVQSQHRRLRQLPLPSPLLRRQASALLHPDPAASPLCADELFTGGVLLSLPALPLKGVVEECRGEHREGDDGGGAGELQGITERHGQDRP